MTHFVRNYCCGRCNHEIEDGAFAVFITCDGPLVCAKCCSDAELRGFVQKAEEHGSRDIAWLRERVDAEFARRAQES